MKKLSILICHLQGREQHLEGLMNILKPQLCSQVNVLVEKDNGEMSIGNKRNLLLEKSKAEYICFIDDDDKVSGDYIDRILHALNCVWISRPEDSMYNPEAVVTLNSKPDVIGICGKYQQGQNPPQKFIHSIVHSEWKTEFGIHYRCPNHLNPVKRVLALKAGFTDKDHGEDLDYSMALRDLLRTEVFIDKPIYYYIK